MAELAPSRWRPSSGWDLVAPAIGSFGADKGLTGVAFELLDHLDLATIIMREAARDRFAEAMSSRFELTPPEAGRASFGPEAALIWSAPNQWLAVASEPGGLNDLSGALDGTAAVTEQGDGRAVVRISGPAARRALTKSIAIDLHPDVFGVGRAATTVIAHVSIQLWVEDDDPTFVLVMPRTFARSIWRCLTVSAAEFGYRSYIGSTRRLEGWRSHSALIAPVIGKDKD